MTSKKLIDEFLSQKNIAVVGVSRSGKNFGCIIYNDLKSRGYNVYPVNPHVETIDGEKCYSNLLQLKGKAEAAILIIPPSATEEVVTDARSAGIKMIWMQQGSESEKAVEYCEENKIDVIDRECILMFLEPAGFIHKAHKWIWGVMGKLPQ
jgi:uncharacterized protein